MSEFRFLQLPLIALFLLLPVACNNADPPAEGATATDTATDTPVTTPATAPVEVATADDAPIEEGPVSPEAPVDDIFRVADAERLLDEMIAAYSNAPAIKDYIVQESWLVDKENPLRDYTFYGGQRKNMRLVGPDSEFLWINGDVYATARTWPDRYLRVRGKEDLYNHTVNHFGGFASPLQVPMALRLAKSRTEVLHALDLNSPDPSRISSYRRRTDKQGRDREVLSIISGSGSARYYVDPETKLIMEADVEYAPSDAPEGIILTKHLAFHPEIMDELPEPIAFDPGDRIRVVTIAALLGRGK